MLLVEDEEADAELFRSSLHKEAPDCGFEWVRDGESALSFLRKEDAYQSAFTPDLIFLDWGLPRLSGLDVLKIIKHDSRVKTIPVIVYSGTRAPEDVRQAYEYHASAFLTKQMELDQLVRVHRTLREFWLNLAILPE
ncbi:MAG: response regulator [Polyangiales bacterium]